MVELVKDVPGYETLYSVSNLGKLFSTYKRGGELKLNPNSSGYINSILCKEGVRKNHYLHRLVAELFIPNPQNLLEVNHIDENKTNNHYTNLEWVTRQYNAEYTLAKYYLVTFPCGKTEVVYNLNRFCNEYYLSCGNMVNVAKGNIIHHKGFKCSYIEEK